MKLKFARDILDTLIERRLWPIAVLLLAGLVAVPIALSKSAAPPPPAPPRSLDAGMPEPVLAPPSATLVAAIGSGRGLSALPDRNPFAQRRVKGAKAGVGGASGVIKTGGAAGSPSGGAGPGLSTGGGTRSGGTAGGGIGGGGAPIPTPTPGGTVPGTGVPRPSYLMVSADLSFGPIDHQVRHRNLPRLSPLPNVRNPLVVYLGVMRGTRTSVFLISSEVHPTGDGRCFPSARVCQTVHLREGGTEFFDVYDANGASRQYELDMNKLTFRRTDSQAAAARSYMRVAPGGARAFKALGARHLDVRFERSTGRLVRTRLGSGSGSGAAGGGGSGGSSAPAPLPAPPDAGLPPSSIGSLRDHGSPALAP